MSITRVARWSRRCGSPVLREVATTLAVILALFGTLHVAVHQRILGNPFAGPAFHGDYRLSDRRAIEAASITRVGTNSASAPTVTIPAHQAGDLIFITASRNSSGTAPSVPAGYSLIPNTKKAQGANVSFVSGYRIAIGTADTSGTWTNAAELAVAVYRPSAGNVLRIGQSASNSSTTTTVNFPALTMADPTSGNSWVIGVAAANNITQTLGTAPSGMTNQQHLNGSVGQISLSDTNGGVSSWASTNITAGTGDSVTATIEIVLAPKAAGIWGTNVYQHVKGGGNAFTRSQSGNGFKCPLDQPSGANNTYVLTFTCDGGATVSSVTGTVNGALTLAESALGGTGNLDTYTYILQGITAGTEVLKVTFGANVTVFYYEITEYYGVATSGFVATTGTTVQSQALNTATSTGSLTPPNNNGTGGNLVHSAFHKANAPPAAQSSGIFPGASFTMLGADIGWYNTTNLSDSATHAAQAQVQATSAAITPQIVSVAETGDQWNSIAVVLQISAASGTAPSGNVQYRSMHHFSTMNYPTAASKVTWEVQCPCNGNLRSICSDDGNLGAGITVWDNEGVVWTPDGTGVPGAGFWFRLNTSNNPNLVVYVGGGGSDQNLSFRFSDVYGNGTWSFDSAVTSNQTLNGLASFTSSPAPTPSSASGIVKGNIGLGQGPGLGLSAPVGAIFALCTYTGETDTDTIENADLMGHLIYTASGAQTWTWNITNNATNSSTGGFIAFKLTPPAAAAQLFDDDFGDFPQLLAGEDDGHEADATAILCMTYDSAPVGPAATLLQNQDEWPSHEWGDHYEEPLVNDLEWSGPIQPNAPPDIFRNDDLFGLFFEDENATDELLLDEFQQPALATMPVEDPWPHFDDETQEETLDWDSQPVGAPATFLQYFGEDAETRFLEDESAADELLLDDVPQPIVVASFVEDAWDWSQDESLDETLDFDSAPVGAAAVFAQYFGEDAESTLLDELDEGDWWIDEPVSVPITTIQYYGEDAEAWHDDQDEQWLDFDGQPVGPAAVVAQYYGDDAELAADDQGEDLLDTDQVLAPVLAPQPPEDAWDHWSDETHEEFPPPPDPAVPPPIAPPIVEDGWDWSADETLEETLDFYDQPIGANARVLQYYGDEAETAFLEDESATDELLLEYPAPPPSFTLVPTNDVVFYVPQTSVAYTAQAEVLYIPQNQVVYMPQAAQLQKFRPKLPSEEQVLTFNMAGALTGGNLLEGTPTVVSVTSVRGDDSNPTEILNGSPELDATQTLILVPVKGGIMNSAYIIEVNCASQQADVQPSLAAILPIGYP